MKVRKNAFYIKIYTDIDKLSAGCYNIYKLHVKFLKKEGNF